MISVLVTKKMIVLKYKTIRPTCLMLMMIYKGRGFKIATYCWAQLDVGLDSFCLNSQNSFIWGTAHCKISGLEEDVKRCKI